MHFIEPILFKIRRNIQVQSYIAMIGYQNQFYVAKTLQQHFAIQNRFRGCKREQTCVQMSSKKTELFGDILNK